MAAEKNFENKVKAFLDSEGVWWVKFLGCGMTRAGVPDLLCCVNGRFVAVELKAAKGKPSELQVRELQRIRKAGGFADVLYPKDFEDFKRLVRELKADA